jgi:cyclopropane fatty-acyl-phospholipid synthase-like methyltransferase
MRRDWKAFWAQQDDPRHPHSAEFFRNHGHEFALLCGDLAGKSILEFGCGSGALFGPMGFERARAYRGVDSSEKMMTVFRNRYPQVDLICADAADYKDGVQYDLIFSSSLAQYFSYEEFRRHIANARTMLAPGGSLLVGSVPWRGARAAFHLQAANPASTQGLTRRLAALARSYAGFDPIGYWYSYRECTAIARRHGLTPSYFGCLHMPYRFHVRMDDRASA